MAVRGPVDDKELRVDSNKIWPAASADTFVSIKLPAADIFKFGDGGLCSDYVAEEEVQHAVYENTEGRGPTPVLEADYEERGIGSFCIRMTCIISKSSSARTGVMLKWTVLLFPDAKERILESLRGGEEPGLARVKADRGGAPHAAKAYNSLEVPHDPPRPSRPGDQPEPGPASPGGPQEDHRGHHGEGSAAGDLQDRECRHHEVEEASQQP